MNHVIALRGAGAAERRPASGLLAAYLRAAAATSASGFLYLHTMRRIAASDGTATLDSIITLYWTAGALAPIAVALKGLFFAGLVWGILQLLDVHAAFTKCLETMWLAEFLLVAPQAIFAAAALLRGATAQSQLFVPLGLDLIWRPSALPFALLAHAVNVFWAGWCVFVFARLSALDAAHGRRSRVAVATILAGVLVVLLPILQLT